MRAITVGLLLLGLCAAGAGAAEPPPAAANPLDAVPERMPFDIPFGEPISITKAKAVIDATTAEARKRGWKLNVAVVDWSGNLVAFERMDGAQIASIAISQHKARTSATFRRETKVFESGIQGGNTYQLTLDDIIASRGGIPLIEGGKIIGAVGCSGATGSQDEVACKAGAALVK
jgi:uncharacterized protein GlcG (DUF336 family)